MPSPQSISDYLAKQTAAKDRASAAQRNAIAAVGDQAAIVAGTDPYEVWQSHMAAMIGEVEVAVAAARQLFEVQPGPGTTLAEHLLRTRLQLAALDGRLGGLRAARDLIPTLIERGQSA